MDAVEILKLVLSILSGILGILSIIGVGTIFSMIWKDKHDKKKAEKERVKKLEASAADTELKGIIKEEIEAILTPLVTSLREQLTTMSTDLGWLKKGVQSNCRNDLEEIYAKAEKEKYCPADEKQRFEQTYQAYHNLGKNGIMDVKHATLLGMPESKPTKTASRTGKRKRLLEDK